MTDIADIVDQQHPPTTDRAWTLIARTESVGYDRGIAALVENEPVAIFRLRNTAGSDEWYAVSHIDPRTDAPVMARGLVGSDINNDDAPTIASPLHKQRYDLRTGLSLDGSTASLKTFKVLVADGWLMVA